MGRPGLTKHRKFIRLERLLGSHVVARGALETLWDACYENGDEFLGESLDVEGLARWEGEEGQLTTALLSAGFIEAVEGQPGTYQVHDLWHHAPEYVASRRGREIHRKKARPCEFCGQVFHSSEVHAKFCGPACRTAAYRVRHCDGGVTEPCVTVTEPPVTVTDCDVTVTMCDGPPSPSPSPSPSPITTTPLPPASGGTEVAKRKRRSKAQRIADLADMGASPDAIAAGIEIAEFWPKHDGPDNREVGTNLDQLIPRLDDLHQGNVALTFDLLVEAGRAYCESKRSRYKAAQYFFSQTPDPATGKPPFLEFARAVYTKRKLAQEASEAPLPTQPITQTTEAP